MGAAPFSLWSRRDRHAQRHRRASSCPFGMSKSGALAGHVRFRLLGSNQHSRCQRPLSCHWTKPECISGPGENRTLAERLRGACSTFELQARGSHRNRTCLVSVKSRLHHLGANDPRLLSLPELPALACVSSLVPFLRAPVWNRTTPSGGPQIYSLLTAPAACSGCVCCLKTPKAAWFPGRLPRDLLTSIAALTWVPPGS